MLDAQRMWNLRDMDLSADDVAEAFPDAEYIKGKDSGDILVFHGDKSGLFINDEVTIILSPDRVKFVFSMSSPDGLPDDPGVAVDRLGRYLHATDYDANTFIIDGCKVKRNDDYSASIINSEWRGELSVEQARRYIVSERFASGLANEVVDYLANNNIGSWHRVDSAGA